MEFLANLLSKSDKFLDVGSKFFSSTSKIAMDLYQMDTASKMGQLKIDAYANAADAAVKEAALQKKEFEIERRASQVQALQTYAQRINEFNEAAEFNNFVTESRLGGGESMSVRAFMRKQEETVAQDFDAINTEAVAVDSALARQGHMSLLRGFHSARASRQQAMQTAYQNTIDMLQTTPDPFQSVKDVVGGAKTIATSINEALNP